MVGALLAVGEGRSPGRVAGGGARTPASGTVPSQVAPAHGLTLVAVDYPDDGGLAVRAAQTRRRRTR